eukprot:749418-Hanusia_phi.AAC.4
MFPVTYGACQPLLLSPLSLSFTFFDGRDLPPVKRVQDVEDVTVIEGIQQAVAPVMVGSNTF